MSWKKYFKPVNSVLPNGGFGGETKSMSNNKYSSWLPEVYEGPSDRLARYQVYETMDFDHEIHASLDTICDFSTENDAQTRKPFVFDFHSEPTNTEVNLITKSLRQWCVLNEIDKRLWSMFRSTLKYGDQFFIRDPETYKLFWVDPNKVTKVVVNESKGKEIESYIIKDLDLNLKDSIATNQNSKGKGNYNGAGIMFSAPHNGNMNYSNPTQGQGATDGKFSEDGEIPVAAEHVVHLTLCDGLTPTWPFGTSILEQVYKVYKQKELLEDSIIIYRVHRAPERRIFYIDVGQMPPNKAKQHLEQVKYDIQQKRIPSRSGGGANISDSTYNPMSALEDYYIATTSDGRGSKIETLPGGENLGCFTMDTKIKLLDGRDLSISEISEELSDGNELWTYSCHPVTGKVAPGKIDWAGVTKKDATVYKVTLDNGESFECTEDHKFPIIGRGFVELSDIDEGQSLIGVYTDEKPVSNSNSKYTRIYDYEEDSYVFAHRMVSDFFIGTDLYSEFVHDREFIESEKTIRHHVDHNRYNNNPNNLVWMNHHDHCKYHSDNGFSKEDQIKGSNAALERMTFLKENDPKEYQRIIDSAVESRKKWRDGLSQDQISSLNEKISSGISRYFDSLTEDQKQHRSKISRDNFAKGTDRVQYLLKNDEEFKNAFSSAVISSLEKSKSNNPEKWEERSRKIIKANQERWKMDGYYDRVIEIQKVKFNVRLFSTVMDTLRESNDRRKSTISLKLSLNEEFMNEFKELNQKSHSNVNVDTFTERHIDLILQKFGTNWNRALASTSDIIEDKFLVDMKSDMIGAKCFNDIKKVLDCNHKKYGIASPSRYNFIKAISEYGIKDINTFIGYIENVNHRVVSIEKVEEAKDVGTLSVDIDEIYHDYHTYALSAGVFAKNSIDDLRYFNNKMMRALGVPSSYLPTGPEDGTASYNDGRVGTAFIQEFRFAKVCQRYQKQIAKELDKEFKLFLKKKGIEIDNSLFTMKFPEPQSFSEYRQLELDAAKINVFASMSDVPFISKRFALKRYLGLSEEELMENERMWAEENIGSKSGKASDAKGDLSAAGITSSGIDGMAPDDGFEDMDDMGDMGDMDDMGGDLGDEIDSGDFED